MKSVCNASEDRLHNGNNNLLYATRDGFSGKRLAKKLSPKRNDDCSLYCSLSSAFVFLMLLWFFFRKKKKKHSKYLLLTLVSQKSLHFITGSDEAVTKVFRSRNHKIHKSFEANDFVKMEDVSFDLSWHNEAPEEPKRFVVVPLCYIPPPVIHKLHCVMCHINIFSCFLQRRKMKRILFCIWSFKWFWVATQSTNYEYFFMLAYKKFNLLTLVRRLRRF